MNTACLVIKTTFAVREETGHLLDRDAQFLAEVYGPDAQLLGTLTFPAIDSLCSYIELLGPKAIEVKGATDEYMDVTQHYIDLAAQGGWHREREAMLAALPDDDDEHGGLDDDDD
jgi:hypothetical protein